MSDPDKSSTATAEKPYSSQFQPRVDAEEGDPNRGDYAIGALIAVVVIVVLLWAFGVIHLPVALPM